MTSIAPTRSKPHPHPSPRNPWFFIPTLYFAEGVPYVMTTTVSVIFYKKMGIHNAQIAFWTELIAFIWVIKMFWGPVVDIYSTRRTWILYTQLGTSLLLTFIGLALQTSHFFLFSLLGLTVVAFTSATHDIATDGFYMLALSEKNQAFFVGVRSLFYKIATIFGSGFLVYMARRLEEAWGHISSSWTITLIFSAGIMAFTYVYHQCILPYPEDDQRHCPQRFFDPKTFLNILRSYFLQEKIWAVMAYILLYRFGEAMLVKMVPPFLLDSKEMGGLRLTTSEVGIVYGTLGVLGLIIGGILGGILIARYGLKRCIWPMALALNLPDLFYIYMAYFQPSLAYVCPLVAVEQFGYGLGFTTFTVFLMSISKGEYKTSHFAISTGIMALGMRLPGMLSGYLQESVGYPLFFILVSLLTIPGMMIIPFLPLDRKNEHEKNC